MSKSPNIGRALVAVLGALVGLAGGLHVKSPVEPCPVCPVAVEVAPVAPAPVAPAAGVEAAPLEV